MIHYVRSILQILVYSPWCDRWWVRVRDYALRVLCLRMAMSMAVGNRNGETFRRRVP